MKPPQRRRTAPARYLSEETGPTAWTTREKRHLLRLLQARRGQPEPDAAELARELPGRSEAEIQRFLQQLKGRVVRQAIQKVHPRRRDAQTPAPIEVWTDLAEKITGPLEEALTVAFSQVLTIAATEPVSLLYSKPPKPTRARAQQLILSVPGGQGNSETTGPSRPTPEAPGSTPKTSGPAPVAPGSTPETSCSVTKAPGPALPGPGAPGSGPEAPGSAPGAPGPVPGAPGSTPEMPGSAPGTPGPTSETSGPALETLSRSLAGSLAEGEFTVDFEKVYKYLSSSSCGSRCPELSAAEAAVVLDLITSLPEELPRLPCAALIKHMEETYRRLTAPQPCPTAGSPPPGAQDIGTGSKGPEGLGPTTPHAGENAGLRDLRPAWRAAGICPLNPFLVPLELLGRAASPAR